MLEEISELLQDGKWHSEEEIARALKISPELVRKAVRFLAKYGLAECAVIAEKKFRWLKDAPGLLQVVTIVRAASLKPIGASSPTDSRLGKQK